MSKKIESQVFFWVINNALSINLLVPNSIHM